MNIYQRDLADQQRLHKPEDATNAKFTKGLDPNGNRGNSMEKYTPKFVTDNPDGLVAGRP